MTNIRKTEVFLREQFENGVCFKEHPADGEYRLQHSYRVAHGRMSARLARSFLEQLDLRPEHRGCG